MRAEVILGSCHVNKFLVYTISVFKWHNRSIPAGNYMFKVNNRNTRTRCQICSKLTIKISADIDINFKIPDECRQFCGYRSDWRDCLDLKLYVFKNYSGDHKLFLKSLKIPGTFKKNHKHLWYFAQFGTICKI